MDNNTIRHATAVVDEIIPSLSENLDQPESTPALKAPFRSGITGWLNHYRWLIVVALAALGLLFYLSGGTQAGPAMRPLTALVQEADIESAVTAAGTLQPGKFVDVGAQVSGQLKKLHVAVGDHVASGQLVAEIDAAVQLNRVEASRANLEALDAQVPARESSVALAQARLERQTNMLARNASSQDDYDDAVDRLASAQSSMVQLRSQIAQARATLGSDEATLGYSRIYAPIEGTVVSIDMQVGQTLNATQVAPTIMRIANLSTMTVKTEVSEADVSKLTPGMGVYFTTLGSGERRWTGKLRQILPTPVIENNVVLYTALFDVNNADRALLINMTAQVFFVTESAYGVLSVPVGALSYSEAPTPAPNESMSAPVASITDNGGSPSPREGDRSAVQFKQNVGRTSRSAIVRVVENDGEIVNRTIEVGVTNRILAEVRSGLRAGETVVVGFTDAPGDDT